MFTFLPVICKILIASLSVTRLTVAVQKLTKHTQVSQKFFFWKSAYLSVFWLVGFFSFTHLSFLKSYSTHSSDCPLILPTSLLQSSDPAFSSLLSVCPFSISKLESIHTFMCPYMYLYTY